MGRSSHRARDRCPYKKTPAIGEQCIPPRLSHLVAADMNLAFTFSCMMAVVWLMCGKCETAPELISNPHQRIHKRPLLRGFSMEDLLEAEDENLEFRKRQQFDDYGHLRFGKREHFDDYGHMRFGRNHE